MGKRENLGNPGDRFTIQKNFSSFVPYQDLLPMPRPRPSFPSKTFNIPGARVLLPVSRKLKDPRTYFSLLTMSTAYLIISRQDCWLCLDLQPPHCIGIGTNQTISPLTDKIHCDWKQFKLVRVLTVS